MINFNKLFDIENGLGIEEGVKITSGDASPLLLTPLDNTLYIQNRGAWWFYKDSSWRLVDYKNFFDSEEVIYSGDTVTNVIYKKSSFKVFQIDLTYVNEIVTKEELSFFDTDGITLVRKITNNYSYSGDLLSSLSRAEI